jgi:protein TonB
MFEDSLIESGGKLRTKRGATTLFSFILEVVIIGVLILIPLIYTEALPKNQLTTFLVAPPPPPPPPPPPAAVPQVKIKKIETEIDDGQLRQPTKIPQKIKIIQEDEAPPPTGAVVGGVPGGIPGGVAGGVMGSIIGATNSNVVPTVRTPQRVRVSQGVSEGLLVHQVRPVYPQLARAARIQGQVVLQASIGKDGSIQNLRLVSGHPMLAPSAIDAVKQWKYKPYFLNGEAVEVDTQITVNFTLAGG